MAVATITPTYTVDTIIGPDGTAFDRGDGGTTARYDWVSTGDPTTAAERYDDGAGAGTDYDAAWIQYAIEQYPEGGKFRILPPASAGIPYCSQDTDDVYVYIGHTHDDITIECEPGASFKIRPTSDPGPAGLIEVDGAKNFTWRGGRFYKTGSVVKADQAFFYIHYDTVNTQSPDHCTIENVEFYCISTSRAIPNFAAVYFLGEQSSNWDARMLKPRVLGCTANFQNYQQDTAQSTIITGGRDHSETKYGGHMVRSKHTSGLRVKGCTMWGDDTSTNLEITGATWTVSNFNIESAGAFASYTFTTGDTFTVTGGTGLTTGTYTIGSKINNDKIRLTTSCGPDAADLDGNTQGLRDSNNWAGGMLWIQNDEMGVYDDLVAYGVDLMATDATGGDLIAVGKAVTGDAAVGGEGSHYILTGLNVHNLNVRYIVEMMAPLYANVADIQAGRCKVFACIHTGPKGTALPGGGDGNGVIIEGIELHNISASVYYTDGQSGMTSGSVTIAPNATKHGVHIESGSGFSIHPINATLWNQDSLLMKVDDTASDIMFLGDYCLVEAQSGGKPTWKTIDCAAQAMRPGRQRYHLENPEVWRGVY